MKKKSGTSQLPVKTYYYNDEINQEFSGITRNEKIIDEDYKFIVKSPVWRFLSIIVHRWFVVPAGRIYLKSKFHYKIENKEALKPYLSGCYLYGNHTQIPGDGFIQAMVAYPKKSYVIVNSDNMALKGTENIMKMIGAVPLPTTVKGYRFFLKAINQRLKEHHPITIFPEAHIWPYYTGIRPFPSASFGYAVKSCKPAFSFTTVYKKRPHSNLPNIVVYIDGPFFPDVSLSHKAATEKLRDEVYNAMKERAKLNDCEYYKYIRQDQNEKGV